MNMFASLKNKIKEETGSDITNLPILTNQALKLTTGRFKGKHTRQGSGSSIGSISLDSVTDENPSSPLSLSKQDVSEVKFEEGKVLTAKELKRLEKHEEEWKKLLLKKEEDWTKRLEKKEEEFKKQLEEQQKEWKRSLELLEKEKNALEDEKREVVKQKLGLEEALKVAEEYKKKVYQYQEDIDQLEGFQTQEMAKIKHLLLVKEQELAAKEETLKDSNSQIEALKSEVTKLLRYEEDLSNLQETSNNEKSELLARIDDSEKQLKDSTAEQEHLNITLKSEQERAAKFERELQQAQLELREEQERCKNLKQSLNHEKQDKDAILLRNAQVSQEVQLAQQATREQERDLAESLNQIASLEEQLSVQTKEVEKWKVNNESLSRRVQDFETAERNKQAALDLEKDLRRKISELEEQVAERNKSVKVLQQRLADMKKTLQRELRGPVVSSEAGSASDSADGFSSFLGSNAGSASLSTNSMPRNAKSASQLSIASSTNSAPREESDDINFKYLKHVLIKFLTSREYEAQHLTRAVATLLKFTPEEETLLRETLEWKMSWFGTRPALGMGQTSKTIPPS